VKAAILPPLQRCLGIAIASFVDASLPDPGGRQFVGKASAFAPASP